MARKAGKMALFFSMERPKNVELTFGKSFYVYEYFRSKKKNCCVQGLARIQGQVPQGVHARRTCVGENLATQFDDSVFVC